MSQTIRQTIAELETRAKQYEIGAAKSRQAAQQLRDLLQLDAPTGSSVKVSAPPAAKKPPGSVYRWIWRRVWLLALRLLLLS